MNLGQKIKRLRNKKMMTQSELAGDEITRNMLSQIENGSAQPSLSTVAYLAGKLGVPAGYLLSEGDEEFLYNKSAAMRNIKRAYTDGNFGICREMCLSSFDEYDDELELILTDCCLGEAEECIKSGKLYHACSLLDDALLHSRKTIYNTATQKNRIFAMFLLLKEISPALDSNEADIDVSSNMLHPLLFEDVFCKYIAALFDVDSYFEMLRKAEVTNDEDKLFISHLKARKYMSSRDYKKAKNTLSALIDGDAVLPRLLLYFACADMEICCKEIDDYRGAYEFSNNKIDILEHMLGDN